MPSLRAAGLLLLAIPAAASAQSMNADLFYGKAQALKKKGAMALFSSDLKLLMREGQAAGKAAGTARRAAVAAGRLPRFCPPAEVKGMSSDEFLDRLGTIPAAERRRIDMTEATNRLLAVKYPCRA